MNPYEGARKHQHESELAVFPPYYSGPRRWMVEHPDYREPLLVKAPDEAAALVAAANKWDTEWYAWRYHGKAKAIRVK